MGPAALVGGDPSKLVSLGPAAHYEDPKFSWVTPVAPTDAFFMPTAAGRRISRRSFRRNLSRRRHSRFQSQPEPKNTALTGPLADDVADNTADERFKEQSSLIFGSGFDAITDLTNGPGRDVCAVVR